MEPVVKHSCAISSLQWNIQQTKYKLAVKCKLAKLTSDPWETLDDMSNLYKGSLNLPYVRTSFENAPWIETESRKIQVGIKLIMVSFFFFFYRAILTGKKTQTLAVRGFKGATQPLSDFAWKSLKSKTVYQWA